MTATSYAQTSAILTRIREVLEFGRGTLRNVPLDRFYGDLQDGLSDTAELIRSVEKPRIAASIKASRPSPATPPRMGNMLIDELDVEVRVIRLVEPLAQNDDDTSVALQALAWADAGAARQALEFPNNVIGSSKTITGVGATFPTGFSGGETLIPVIDGTAVTVTFTSGDQTLAQCISRIQAAITSAGFIGRLCVGTLSGQIQLASNNGGTGATLSVTGSGATTLGFTSPVTVAGVDADLASGLLTYNSSTAIVLGDIDSGAQRLQTVHLFTGSAISRPATS